MKQDLPSVIQKVCKFLGKDVLEGEKLEGLCQHLSFDKMKNNSAVNKQEMVQVRKTEH